MVASVMVGYLGNELGEGTTTVTTTQRRQVQVHPLTHQVVSLLGEAGWVVDVTCLLHAR